MKQTVSRAGKAGTDLVKDSTLMTRIDTDAWKEKKIHEVGGEAYESSYIDNMTVTHLMSINKSDKKQDRINDDDKDFPIFAVLGIIGLAIIVAIFVIYKL